MAANIIDGKPVEIERKYLIELPGEEQLEIIASLDGYSSSKIEQIYLDGDEGGRIRKRVYPDITRCFFTLKKDIGGITRYESEHEISLDEYTRLSKNIRKGTHPIKKTRYCFIYDGQLFEMDIYDFKASFAVLEIELQSEEQPVKLPDFLTVTADVSRDKRFRNYSLAKDTSPLS